MKRDKNGTHAITLRSLGFLESTWLTLTPRERLKRSWRLRKRISNLQAVHDAKLWPKP